MCAARFQAEVRSSRNPLSPTSTVEPYDKHVALLLDEAVYHSEHLRLGLPESPESAM